MRVYTASIFNVIQTTGFLTGLKYKRLEVYQFGKKLLSIPLYPVGFSRKEGLEIRELDQMMTELIEVKRKDSEN